MTRNRRLPETEVGSEVVRWLRDLGWETYQEVQIPGSKRADIVGVRGPLIWIVECKVGATLQLLDQAAEWIGRAHYISIATAKEVSNKAFTYAKPSRFTERFVRDLGIGWFVANGGNKYNPTMLEERWKPPLRRKAHVDCIRRALHDEQKSQVAGAAGGGYSTPFSRTCDALKRYLAEHRGCTLKEAIDGIDHHYSSPSSARGSLSQWIRAGRIEGVKLGERGLELIDSNDDLDTCESSP